MRQRDSKTATARKRVTARWKVKQDNAEAEWQQARVSKRVRQSHSTTATQESKSRRRERKMAQQRGQRRKAEILQARGEQDGKQVIWQERQQGNLAADSQVVRQQATNTASKTKSQTARQKVIR